MNAYWAGSNLVVLRREPDGTVHKQTLPAEHVSFVRKEDATQALRDRLRESRFVLGVTEEPGWIRIRWLTRSAAKETAQKGGWFEKIGVKAYEGDVDPVRRWLTDTGAELQRPRRCYVDLEADSRVPFSQMTRMRVLAWSIVSEDGSFKRAEVLGAEDDDAEAALLRAFWRALLDYDQVVSWNGDRFDFALLELASQRVAVAVEPRRWLWLDHMRVYERFDKATSGEEKKSMALGAVARATLGEERSKLVKLGELDGETSWGMWAAGGESRERLRLYCLDDAELMREIEGKTGHLELLQSIAEATHTLPDSRCQNPTRYVEGFLLALGKERGMHFPTWNAPARRGEEEEGEEAPQGFKGAFNLEPTKRGVLRNVHVCDFARLYPSAIVSFNLSPETWLPDVRLRETNAARPVYLWHLPPKEFPRPEGTCEAPLVDRCFANEPQGILALAVLEMLRLRKVWDDEKKKHAPGTPAWLDADRRSQAYKIAANAFFGVVGSPWSRFFVSEVAESIAQAGVWLLKETIRAAEERGWRVIYGATDSLFVQGPSRAEFQRWTEDLNENLYPRLLREKGCARCLVKLEAEKGFDVLVLVRSNGYAGRYAYFKGRDADADSEPEIKGFEYKSSAALRLTTRMQEEAILLLLTGDATAEQLVELVERWRRRVLEEPLELADVMQSKRLSKAVREYKREKKKGTDEWSARPPHVEVAALLQERGRQVGAGVRIEFFLVDGSTSPAKHAPAEDWKGEVDRFGVWEDAVYPPTMRVLEACFPGTQWKRWEKVRPRRGGAPAGGAALFTPGQLARRPGAATETRVSVAGSGRLRGRSPEPPRGAAGQGSLFDPAPHPDAEEAPE